MCVRELQTLGLRPSEKAAYIYALPLICVAYFLPTQSKIIHVCTRRDEASRPAGTCVACKCTSRLTHTYKKRAGQDEAERWSSRASYTLVIQLEHESSHATLFDLLREPIVMKPLKPSKWLHSISAQQTKKRKEGRISGGSCGLALYKHH